MWHCDPDNLEHPDPDNLTGYFTGDDTQPIGGVVQVCHPGHGDEVRRYIAVATTDSVKARTVSTRRCSWTSTRTGRR